MQSDFDVTSDTIRLLSTIDLDEVATNLSEFLEKTTEVPACALLMWDPDLERIADRYVFGHRKKELNKFISSFCENFSEEQNVSFFSVDIDGLDVTLSADFLPIIGYQIRTTESLCAVILLAGLDNATRKTAETILANLPLSTILGHAWEYREFKRENERLRSQYEEMEDETSHMEEQTRKLIHDLTARESIRTKQVERERLVYWISNAVRSSVQIREVLETTVEKIGTTLGVSRCLLLRSVNNTDQLEVFEFAHQHISSIKDLFFSDAGFAFTHAALTRTSPHDLQETEFDQHSTYSATFLRQLGIRSGLIVPLVMREKVLGVLFLQDCAEPRQWSIDDVSLIGSLADNLSVAIENAELHQEREMQAVTDGLTGIANRRYFNEVLTREFERARRHEQSLSLIIVDLDYLKKINDTYGHQAGDEAIKAIGKVLKQSSRSIDLPARYGGEEFCLLLPNTDIEMATQLAERLRKLINEVEIEGLNRISASLGVASFPLHADDADIFFQKADEALYKAKQAGRNRVKVASSDAKIRLSKATGAQPQSPLDDSRKSKQSEILT